MKSPKYHLYLSIEEYRLLFHSLVNLKNRLHYEGKYTDSVDAYQNIKGKTEENLYIIKQSFTQHFEGCRIFALYDIFSFPTFNYINPIQKGGFLNYHTS